MTRSKTWDLNWADGLLLFTIIFWGVNFSVIKFALVEVAPLIFTSLRYIIASIIMLMLMWLTGRRFEFQRRHTIYLIGLGIVGNTFYQLFFIFGAARTTADNASLILATVPVWVALIGTLGGLERLTGLGWLGVTSSLAGIILIILGSDHQATLQFGGATLGGDGLILMAALCWSTYTLLSRKMLRYYSAVAVTSFTMLVGTISLILLSSPLIITSNWSNISMGAWGAVLFSGTCAIALAYFFWNYGVSHLGSTRTSLYSNMVPPIALLTAWLWLGETLTLLQWGGGILAICGVILARRFSTFIS